MEKLYPIFTKKIKIKKSNVSIDISDFKNTNDTNKMNESIDTNTDIVVKTLKKVFGFDSFREPQEEIVRDAVNSNADQFIMIPTGSGKSLCFQLPAQIQGGITVVISPLKSLIHDQLESMNESDLDNNIQKVKSVGLYSDISMIEKHAILDEIINNETDYRLLYTTPEAIDKNEEFIETLDYLYKNGRLTRFVIDEAHCISLWGNDFRYSYRKLGVLKRKYENTPIMALTASATNQVQQDLTYLLNIQNAKKYTKSYYRANLQISVFKRDKTTFNTVVNKINNEYINKSGIIYCISRKSCEKIANDLKSKGINAEAYHAGLNTKSRKLIQNQWKVGIIPIIVATIAFGMGIDKPDVRFVIHFNMPSSLENYYQEIGRAGRDGLDSDCILYYSLQDKIIAEKMLKGNFMSKNKQYTNHQVDKLSTVVKYAENTVDCRHKQICNYLGELRNINSCNSCDNCKKNNNTITISNNIDITKMVSVVIDSIMSGALTKQQIKNRLLKHESFESYKSNFNNDNLLFDRIFNYLIVNKYVKEKLVRNDSGFWTENYQLYSKCKKIINNEDIITIELDKLKL